MKTKSEAGDISKMILNVEWDPKAPLHGQYYCVNIDIGQYVDRLRGIWIINNDGKILMEIKTI